MQKHAMLSLMSLTLLALLPVIASAAAPTVGPDPVPMGDDAADEEGVATYAAAPASNGLSLSIGQGLGLASWGTVSLNSLEYGSDLPLVAPPNAGLRVGYRMNNLVAYGTLDYERAARTIVKGHCIEVDTGFEDDCKTWGSEDKTLSLLTIGGGARYLLDPPTANLTIAYATAGLVLTVPGTSNSSLAEPIPGSGVTKEAEAEKTATGALGFGLIMGGGAEYFLGEGFSIGGEAGVAFHTMSWEDGNKSQSSLSIYSSVLLNFYL